MPTGITQNSTKVGLKQIYALNSSFNSVISGEGKRLNSSSDSCFARAW